jgi:hypothetical protein
MVRIIWGLAFIFFGTYVLMKTIVTVSLLQLTSEITVGGSTVTLQMLEQANFFYGLVFSFVFYFLGAAMIYYGDIEMSHYLEPPDDDSLPSLVSESPDLEVEPK